MLMSSCGAPLTTSQVSYMDGLSLGRFGIADPETGLVFTLTYNFPIGPRCFCSIPIRHRPYQQSAGQRNLCRRSDRVQPNA